MEIPLPAEQTSLSPLVNEALRRTLVSVAEEQGAPLAPLQGEEGSDSPGEIDEAEVLGTVRTVSEPFQVPGASLRIATYNEAGQHQEGDLLSAYLERRIEPLGHVEFAVPESVLPDSGANFSGALYPTKDGKVLAHITSFIRDESTAVGAEAYACAQLSQALGLSDLWLKTIYEAREDGRPIETVVEYDDAMAMRLTDSLQKID